MTATAITITYHALRRVGGRIEEIRVSRDEGDPYWRATEDHVAWHDDLDAAFAALREANGITEAS